MTAMSLGSSGTSPGTPASPSPRTITSSGDGCGELEDLAMAMFPTDHPRYRLAEMAKALRRRM